MENNQVLINHANDMSEKKVYTTPELKKYGSLAELVQNNPGGGTDGGAPGCNLS